MNKANDVIDEIASRYGITRMAMLGKRRIRRYAYPRAVACYILHIDCGMSCTKVGEVFSCTHSNVLYHCRNVGDWLRMPALNSEAVKIVREVEKLHGLTNEQLN